MEDCQLFPRQTWNNTRHFEKLEIGLVNQRHVILHRDAITMIPESNYRSLSYSKCLHLSFWNFRQPVKQYCGKTPFFFKIYAYFLKVLYELIDFCFNGRSHKYISVNKFDAKWVSKPYSYCVLIDRCSFKNDVRHVLDNYRLSLE